MTLRIVIEMSNAAFEDAQGEPARILKHVVKGIEEGSLEMSLGSRMRLRDINGNNVGEARVTR